MRTLVDARLREEAQRYGLRHTCEHCVYGVPPASCMHGYPTDEHRVAIASGAEHITFCKEFEMG
jgi:hypothetical protein